MESERPECWEGLEHSPVINAAGTKTRIGGSRIRPEAAEEMRRASQHFIDLEVLQSKASGVIRELTGAEAGYVTNGAASGLTLSAAACLAGNDIARMDRLPDTDGFPDEIIMPRTTRTSYDHALRLAGATIVDVGSNDHALGTGATSVKPWEISAAVTDDTAALAYVHKSNLDPELSTMTDVAEEHDLPVIVDAAAELPPKDNLSKFIDAGADLVVFSGGKAIRGPQSSGIVAGRSDLIQSIALQHLDMHVGEEMWNPPSDLIDTDTVDGVPNQGIGRTMKVGKEELAGLIRALELFSEEDHATLHSEWMNVVQSIAADLQGMQGVAVSIDDGPNSAAPELVVTIDSEHASHTARTIVGELKQGEGSIIVGTDDVSAGKLVINPMCLNEEEVSVVRARLTALLDEHLVTA